MALSSPGIGSGLDIKGMVEAMVKSDVAHTQARHDKKLIGVNSELSAIGHLKSSLSTLQASLSNLSNISQFYTKKNTISEPGFFNATIGAEANAGVYQIQVDNLAQSQSLSSDYYANSNTPVGNGTLTIDFGTYSNNNTSFAVNASATQINVVIAPGSDSLTAVCDAINASGSSVNASIVQDSLGSRLSIVSTKTGVDNAMKITSTIPELNYDPIINNTSLTQNLAAQNSVVKINGLTITQSSNQLDNALKGITLNLTQADSSKTINLTIENNKDQLTNCVHEFIKKYNDCMSFLNNVTSFNQETKQGGFFQGDPQVKNLKLNLYQAVTNFIPAASSPIKDLAEIGINTTKSGLLEIDSDKLNLALNNNYNSIGALFAKSVNATDPNIQLNSLNTQAPAGVYDVVLNTFTPGVSMSGTIGGQAAISTDGVTLKGTGNLNSLSLNVIAGNSGNRGQVIVNDGLAVLMDDLIDNYLGKGGEFEQRNDYLNKQLKQLTTTQEEIDSRSVVLEKNYLRQWNAVDLLISRLQDTSSMLTQVLAGLPKLKIND